MKAVLRSRIQNYGAPFVGKLAYFRVYSGVMNSGSYVLECLEQKKERVGRILQMHANKREAG